VLHITVSGIIELYNENNIEIINDSIAIIGISYNKLFQFTGFAKPDLLKPYFVANVINKNDNKYDIMKYLINTFLRIILISVFEDIFHIN